MGACNRGLLLLRLLHRVLLRCSHKETAHRLTMQGTFNLFMSLPQLKTPGESFPAIAADHLACDTLPCSNVPLKRITGADVRTCRLLKSCSSLKSETAGQAASACSVPQQALAAWAEEFL